MIRNCTCVFARVYVLLTFLRPNRHQWSTRRALTDISRLASPRKKPVSCAQCVRVQTIIRFVGKTLRARVYKTARLNRARSQKFQTHYWIGLDDSIRLSNDSTCLLAANVRQSVTRFADFCRKGGLRVIDLIGNPLCVNLLKPLRHIAPMSANRRCLQRTVHDFWSFYISFSNWI